MKSAGVTMQGSGRTQLFWKRESGFKHHKLERSSKTITKFNNNNRKKLCFDRRNTRNSSWQKSKKPRKLLGKLTNTRAKICNAGFLMVLWWQNCWQMYVHFFLNPTCWIGGFCMVPELAFMCVSDNYRNVQRQKIAFFKNPNQIFLGTLFTGGFSWLAKIVPWSIIWQRCLQPDA